MYSRSGSPGDACTTWRSHTFCGRVRVVEEVDCTASIQPCSPTSCPADRFLIGTHGRMTDYNTHDFADPRDIPMVLATCVERSLHASLDGFAHKKARLYGVSIVDLDAARRDDDGALRITFLAEHGDVYELLEAPTNAVVRAFDAAVVLTTGWAAPLGDHDGTPPSEHPERRRVRLVVVVCDEGVASVLRFADAPDDIVTDAGSARGSLADAVAHLWFDPPVHASPR